MNDKIDIYHGLSHELPHFIPRSIHRVVTIHDLVAWRHPEYFNPFDVFMHRIKMRHSCNIAEVVVAISEQTKRDIIEYIHVPEEKIRVLYQSCDDIFWQPVEASDIVDVRDRYHLPEQYVIAVGTIEDRKNQLTLIEAFKQIPNDMHLVLVGRGRGKYQKKVEQAIRTQGLSDRVHWLRNAAFEDFPALYAGSRAAVYISLFEGFGIPILEAMCSGAVVLTSNCSSMPEVGGDAVLYADPQNCDEVAKQLCRLLDDDTLRADLLARSKERVKLFTSQKISDDFFNLYTEIMKK